MLKLSKFSSLSKQLRQKKCLKKRALADTLATSATKETLSKLFSLLKKTLRAKWNILSNPDVESCQIATETIKIEKNDQGLTQISAVSVTERQNHWSTPNIKYVLSTRLVNLNLALVASSLPSTPRKRRKESPRTRLSLTSGAPFHSTPIFSRSQNTNSDWAIVSFSYWLFTSLTIWF